MKTMIWTVAIALLASGCWEADGETQEKSSQNQQGLVAEAAMPAEDWAGERIASRCGNCHNSGTISTTHRVPHLAGQRLEYLVRELKAYREGARDNAAMHAVVKSLSNDEVQDVAIYFAMHGDNGKALSRSNPKEWPKIFITPAAGKWAQKCNRCHDDKGFGDHGRYPILTGQRKEYLANAMHAYQSKFLRDSSTMHAMTELLSVKDIDDIAKYYAFRSGKERVSRPVAKQAESDERVSD